MFPCIIHVKPRLRTASLKGEKAATGWKRNQKDQVTTGDTDVWAEGVAEGVGEKEDF